MSIHRIEEPSGTGFHAMKRALVFDSGVGGLSVLDAIVAAGYAVEVDYAADNAWLPYGEKSDEALRARVPALIASLAAQLQPDIVVVACNTASTIALEEIRARMTIPVVGVVPPIKPAAAMSLSRVIGLLATPATVARPYTRSLIETHAADTRVIAYGSSALVNAAEAKLHGRAFDPHAIQDAIRGLFGQPGGESIDVVALACTHFPFLGIELAAQAPRHTRWIDSAAAVARRTQSLLRSPAGTVCTRKACFTSAQSSMPPFLLARGFQEYIAIDPSFRLLPA